MPRALITGATAGLGAAFAGALAAEGSDLILVARNTDRLAQTSAQLSATYGVAVETISADLATIAGCDTVAARLARGEVDTLINNAGIGLYKQFGQAPLADEQRLLDLNVQAVMRLSYAAAEAMKARDSGLILNVSSVAAFVPRGAVATYSAAKAYVSMFSEALAVQYSGTGVRVCSVCPGYTHTEFHQRASADMSFVPSWMWLRADAVVAEALRDARRGKVTIIPDIKYKLLIGAARLLPGPVLRRVMGRQGM